MRELSVWVPEGHGQEVADRAAQAGATHALRVAARTEHGAADLLLLHMPNEHFDEVIEALDGVEDVRMAFQRDSVILLEPPAGNLPDQVADTSSRGPLEILVEGLQGLGSHSTFFVYSSVAGAIAWAGLATNTVFLLTAAQLIAPYAAPALTAAYASARGDGTLLARSVGRYLASLAVSSVVAAVLTLITGLDLVTELMLQVADVSAAAVVLPIAAGVAGAFAFSQADRTTIAPGAAIGMLVAVALAPQAALLGMAAVLGEPRVLASSALVAGLQLVGINAAATLVFLGLGVRLRLPRVRPGHPIVRAVSLGVTGVALVGLLGLQYAAHPELTRETVVTRAEAAATAAVDELQGAVAVEATARFPLEGDPQVLVIQIVAVQLDRGADETAVADAVLGRLEASVPGVGVQLGVTLLEAR